MATTSLFSCDVCGETFPKAEHKLRVSLRDATNPLDEKEKLGAKETCGPCARVAGGELLEQAVARADATERGYVGSWVVRIDCMPLVPMAVPAAAATKE